MYLNTLYHEFSVITVTEIWATADNAPFLSTPSYQRINLNRENGRGGGVALFIRKQLSCSLLSDLHVSDINFSFESLFIEISDGNVMKRIIGVIYRPLNTDIYKFLIAFDTQVYLNVKRNVY